MKVRMKRNAGHLMHCPLSEGQTGEVPDEMGEQLVKSGTAVCLDEPEAEPILRAVDPPAAIQAVPPPEEVAPVEPTVESESPPLSKRKRRRQQAAQTDDSQAKE